MYFKFGSISIVFVFLLSSCKERKSELLEKHYLTNNELFEVEKLINEEGIKNDTLFLDLRFGDTEKSFIEKLENHVKVNNFYKDKYFAKSSILYYMIPFKSIDGVYKCAVLNSFKDSLLDQITLYFNFENEPTLTDLQTYVQNQDPYGITKYKYNLNQDNYKFYLTTIFKNSFNILDAYVKKYGIPIDIERNIDISNLQNNEYFDWRKLQMDIISNGSKIYKKMWIRDNLKIVFSCNLSPVCFVEVEYNYIPNIIQNRTKEKAEADNMEKIEQYNKSKEEEKKNRENENRDKEILNNKI
jgi:hypothetical protein